MDQDWWSMRLRTILQELPLSLSPASSPVPGHWKRTPLSHCIVLARPGLLAGYPTCSVRFAIPVISANNQKGDCSNIIKKGIVLTVRALWLDLPCPSRVLR